MGARAIVAVAGLVIGVVVGTERADAATLNVALSGTDSPSCGSAAAPCRSITRAIANANPGDKIVVAPGRYTGSGGPTCSCVVLVDKAVTVESRDGAAVTIIDAEGAGRDVVRLEASGATFGRSGRGFTLRGAGSPTNVRSGLVSLVGASGVVIAGNVASDNAGQGFLVLDLDGHRITDNVATRNGAFGFEDLRGIGGTYERNTADANGGVGFLFLLASTMTLTENVANANGAHGFNLSGNAIELTRNAAHGNTIGFFALGGADHTYRGNLATGNEDSGLRLNSVGGTVVVADNVVSTSDVGIVFSAGGVVSGNTVSGNGLGLDASGAGATEVRRNAFVGNATDGLRVADGVTVTQNNIYGNGTCGLRNSSAGQVLAPQNFWGAPTGPDVTDPADPTCGSGTTVVTPFATKPFNIPVKAGP